MIKIRTWHVRSNWRQYAIFVTTLACSVISLSWNGTMSFKRYDVSSLRSQPALAASSLPANLPSDGHGPIPDETPAVAIRPGSRNNTYTFGNCTYYVAMRREVPARWGNASNWYASAQRIGYKVGTVPTAGAIGWTPAGWAGHVVFVEKVEGGNVLISEMNYYGVKGGGYNRVDQRWVAAGAFKYIY